MGIDYLARLDERSGTEERAFASRFRAGRWFVFLAAGWLAQSLLRVWLCRHRDFPWVLPDEAGYLLAARVLAGGPDGDMSGSTFHGGGYPLLLAPVFWFTDDPLTAYRAVLVINAMMSAAILPLAYLALRRLRLSRAGAFALAHATALLPAAWFYAQSALADTVLPVLVLAWLLLVHSWLSAERFPRPLIACAASLVAAFGCAVHSRGSVILAVHLCVLVAAAVRRWAAREDIKWAGAVVIAGTGAAMALNAWLRSHTYPSGARSLTDLLWHRLTTSDGQLRAVSLAIGQVWHLTVATWGIAGIGLVVMAVVAVRRGGRRAERVTAAMTLAVTLGIAYASSAALPDEHRVGNYVYGRYLACVAPALFLVGCAVLARAGRRPLLRAAAASGAITVLCGTIAWWYAGDRLSRSLFIAYDFPEIGFLTRDEDSLNMADATLAALALLGLVITAIELLRSRRQGAIALGMAVLVVNVSAVVAIGAPFAGGQAPHSTSAAYLPGVEAPAKVAFDRSLSWRVRLAQTYQIGWTEATLMDCREDEPPRGVTVVVVPWPEGKRAKATCPALDRSWRLAATRGFGGARWVAWQR